MFLVPATALKLSPAAASTGFVGANLFLGKRFFKVRVFRSGSSECILEEGGPVVESPVHFSPESVQLLGRGQQHAVDGGPFLRDVFFRKQPFALRGGDVTTCATLEHNVDSLHLMIRERA